MNEIDNETATRFSISAGGVVPNNEKDNALKVTGKALSASDILGDAIPFSDNLNNDSSLPPLSLASSLTQHAINHPHTNIDLTLSNPSLNVLNVSGKPQFTSAMEIAGRKSPISFPSKSPNHSRSPSKHRENNTNKPDSPRAIQQQQQQQPQTASFADFNQFRGSSDSLAPSPSPAAAAGSHSHSVSVSNVPLTPLIARSPTPKSSPLKQLPNLIPIPSSSSLFSNISSATAPSQLNLPTKKWTLPIHFHDIPQNLDSVSDSLQKAFPFNSGVRPVRKLMTLHDAQLKFGKDPKVALKGLVEAKSWRAVAVLASTVLKAIDQRDLDGVMGWWGVRFMALERLGARMADCLRVEVDVFGLGGKEKHTYEEYENGGVGIFKGIDKLRYGSLVSWEIRVVWAREPSLRGLVKESLDRVFELLIEANLYIRARSGMDDVEVWKGRSRDLNLLVVDLLVELGDYRVASTVLKGLIGSAVEKDEIVDFSSALVRIELQLGNIAEAAKWISSVETQLLLSDASPSENIPQLPSTSFTRRDLVLMNRALYAIASAGDWALATTLLTELLEYTQSATTQNEDFKPTTSIPTIVNNISVSHLYTGNVAKALSHMESLVLEMPQLCGGCATLLFNLATLYDLTDNGVERKRRLLGGVVAVHGGDDLDGACLKLG
ncbi:UNVERIFIED_CONTAM: hypothetical protein HDU68_003509 [Siphonaria sp. JEL0065]|nr:hypothetical protein HDU68_003509 [Siphonaria sp. JEL0065]